MNFMEFITKTSEIVKMGMECVFNSLFKDSNGNTSFIGNVAFTYLSLSLLSSLITLAWESFNHTREIVYDEIVRDRIDF